MSSVRLIRPLSRAVVAAAVGSAAMIMVGCTDQPTGQQTNAMPTAETAGASQSASPQSTVSMAFPTGNRASSDLLVEEMAPREARVGQPLTYQIRVTNLRSAPLTGIVLQQRVPGDFRLASESGDANGGDRHADINVGDLGPNQSKTVQVSGTPTRQGTVDTCLSARYNPPMLCSYVNIVAPAISIVAEGPSRADVCQDLGYRYTVTNTGTGTAHHVVLEENLPQGLVTRDGKQTVTADVGDLAAGQSKSVSLNLRAQQPGSYTTQAVARSDDAGRAQAQQVATAVLAPRLSVTVAGPKEDYLGQTLTYQVTVKNNGDAPAADTKVRLGATPGSVAFVSAQNADGSKLSEETPGSGQSLGTLAPGESRTVAINFKTQKEGDLTLDATAEARCAQPVTTPVETRILTITASALVVTHDPDPVRVGNDVIYHISVQNKGSATDHNVTVTATLPDSEQFVKGGGVTSANADGQNVSFGVIPELAPKQSASWDVEAKAVRAADAEVKVNMTSDATRTPAVKIEPTKLYDDQKNYQQRTNTAPPVTPNNSAAPAPAPAPAPDANK